MTDNNQRKKLQLKTSKRVQQLFFAAVLATSTLIVRLGYLQITEAQQFQTDVATQNYSSLPIPGSRGWIYDSAGDVLAADIPVYQILYIRYPNDTLSAANVAKELAPVLSISAAKLENLMINQNPLQPTVTLAAKATQEQMAFVAEHRDDLPGVLMMTVPQRVYPQGELAAHELGFIGPIPANEWSQYQSTGYPKDAQVGLSGLEQSYENVLKGSYGEEKIPVSPAGIPLNQGIVGIPAKAGDNLVLNINGPLEKIAAQDLIARIQFLRNSGMPAVSSGTVVVMNVHTGAVLTMASYPTYNPNWWIGGISNQHYQQYLNNDAGFNRAISGLYMPGSTEKMLTALTALSHHEMTPNLLVDDRGGLQIGTYYMHNWNLGGFGWVGLKEAIEVSDDTYFYQVGLNLGHFNTSNPPANINAWLYGGRVRALNQLNDMGKKFGLTTLTGVDLPGEVPGYVTYANPPTLYDLPAAAIGQEEAYSTIGLCTYIAAIANGGYRYQPQVVHEITNPKGKVIKVIQPHLMDKVPVSQQYLKIIQQGLELATHGSLGTATYYFGNDPINVAGKTGTAESGTPGLNNSVFVGYAPYNKPKIAIAVVIPDVAGEGFTAAAPLGQEVIDAYFAEYSSTLAPTPKTPQVSIKTATSATASTKPVKHS